MPFGRIQLLAAGGALAALVFIAVVFFSPLISPLEKSGVGTNALPGGTAPSVANVPANAFLPNQPQPSSFPNQEAGGSSRGAAPPGTSSITYQAPSFEGIKNFASSSLPAFVPPPLEQTTIALPQVSDAEIVIDPNGLADPQAYVTYFVTHYADIRFDNRKFGSVLKDGNNLPFLPIALIEKGIQDNNFFEARDSLLVYQEFIRARIAFLKSVRVAPGAADLDKKMIGFDTLTLSLADKFFQAAPGTPSEDDFKSFFAAFKVKALSENQNLLKVFGLSAFLERSDPFSLLLRNLGMNLFPAALAEGNEPFGGQIENEIYCTCDAGYLLTIGPPTPPKTGFLFVPMSFLSSPLFFPFKSLAISSWWLGLDLGATTPCLMYAGVGCASTGQGSLVLMTGTSVPGGGSSGGGGGSGASGGGFGGGGGGGGEVQAP